MDDLRTDELEELGEFESAQTSYFYVDAYRVMPDGSYQFLQSTGPWSATQDEAAKVLTGMCVSWANNNPTWRIGVRCFRWTGSNWVRCGFWNIAPCQTI
jgi:hypothetical protein